FGNPKYGDGGLILQNRLDNEYRFVSGEEGRRCKDSTGKRTDVKLPLDIVRTVIDTAVAGGVGPHVAPAVTQSEERNFDRHYALDYRPMMKMLGCELKRKLECKPYSKENGDALSAKYENLGQPFVYEYDGCVYGFDPKVRESNPEFLETLDRYLMARSQRNDEDFAFPKRSPSLYCVQADGGFLADAQTGRF